MGGLLGTGRLGGEERVDQMDEGWRGSRGRLPRGCGGRGMLCRWRSALGAPAPWTAQALRVAGPHVADYLRPSRCHVVLTTFRESQGAPIRAIRGGRELGRTQRGGIGAPVLPPTAAMLQLGCLTPLNKVSNEVCNTRTGQQFYGPRRCKPRSASAADQWAVCGHQPASLPAASRAPARFSRTGLAWAAPLPLQLLAAAAAASPAPLRLSHTGLAWGAPP
jgi:hypothetical protein